jgi:long-chain fatty acid transport protein
MLKTAFKVSAVSLALSGGILSAHAGGLERSSQDFDILFEDGNVVETGATFVTPQRKLKNIRGSVFPVNPVPGQNTGKPFDTEVDEGKSYWVPKLSAKVQLTDDLACAAQYREPWGIDTDSGINNARMFSAIEQKISSRDYGLNCSYRFAAGDKGFFRILGGVSYQELKGKQTKISGVPLDPNNPTKLTFANSTVDVVDSAIGWRLGAAYEIPEIALRASLVYQSKVNYDLDGSVGVALIGVPLSFTTPVSGSVATPQSVEFKFQTGIAPDWLALASVKWTDWKSITKVGFDNSGSGPFLNMFPVGAEVTSLDLYYKDGWTVMGGIGHKFNDQWSGAATVTWDRGTTTGLTSQTDVWLLGLGANYKATQHLEFRLAGAVGILTSGTLDSTLAAQNGGSKLGSKADFGTDVVGGMTLSVKYRF